MRLEQGPPSLAEIHRPDQFNAVTSDPRLRSSKDPRNTFFSRVASFHHPSFALPDLTCRTSTLLESRGSVGYTTAPAPGAESVSGSFKFGRAKLLLSRCLWSFGGSAGALPSRTGFPALSPLDDECPTAGPRISRTSTVCIDNNRTHHFLLPCISLTDIPCTDSIGAALRSIDSLAKNRLF